MQRGCNEDKIEDFQVQDVRKEPCKRSRSYAEPLQPAKDEVTSTQRSASSAAWPLPNDYGLELECADVLEHQLEVARQRVHDCQHLINKLRLDMQVLDVGVKTMKQDIEVTMKELEILQTEICAT